MKDEKKVHDTFLKFFPPFSSFLIDTLHLQESSTPFDELAAIWKKHARNHIDQVLHLILSCVPLSERNTENHIWLCGWQPDKEDKTKSNKMIKW